MISLILGVIGFCLVFRRLWKPNVREKSRDLTKLGPSPMVSIIIPARNESKVLPTLLESIKSIDYSNLEVIVVDDCSTDETAAIATRYAVKLISGMPRPTGWNGKQWSCHQGYEAATGEILIFTDADTIHLPDSVNTMVNFLRNQKADMASSLPFHLCKSWWENLSGPFHLLLTFVTAPYQSPKVGRLFACGQYLAFTREAYERMGGHDAVRLRWVEDLPLANLALQKQLNYKLYTARPLHRVRMYESLSAFVSGWRRNFRAGLGDSSKTAPFEIALSLFALTGGWQFGYSAGSAILMVATIVMFAWHQRKFGEFSWLGALLFPISAGAFCYITMTAVMDMVLGREAKWKDRSFIVPQS